MSGSLKHCDQQSPRPEAAGPDPAAALRRAGGSSRSLQVSLTDTGRLFMFVRRKGWFSGGTFAARLRFGRRKTCRQRLLALLHKTASAFLSTVWDLMPCRLQWTLCGRSGLSSVHLPYILLLASFDVRLWVAYAALASIFRTLRFWLPLMYVFGSLKLFLRPSFIHLAPVFLR